VRNLCFWQSSRWEDRHLLMHQQRPAVGVIVGGGDIRSLPLLIVAVAVGGFACGRFCL
jgi:hypothetical protein